LSGNRGQFGFYRYDPIYDYPEGFSEVLDGQAYWAESEPINLVGPRDAGGIRYLRDPESYDLTGRSAWRWYDPQHPRCWSCGKFTALKWRNRYTLGCRDCGEPIRNRP